MRGFRAPAMPALGAAAIGGLLLLPGLACAQSAYPTAAGGMMVPGNVVMVPNGTGGGSGGAGPTAAPVTSANPLAVTCITGCSGSNVTISSGTVTAVPSSGAAGALACTVGTPSVQCAAAVTSRKLLAIDNESASATVACAFGATPALNTAGSWTIPPGDSRSWSGAFIPNDQVNCIAGAASTPVTVESN